MKKIKICTVVTGKTLKEFLKNLAEIQKVSIFVELRVDYIENLNDFDLDIIKSQTFKESILTCRSLSGGGWFKGSTEKLMQIIHKAIELKFDYVDVELSKLKLIDKSKCNEDVKIIGSYHNFAETPKYRILQNTINFIFENKFVDIAKIATFVNSEDDVINLTKILISKNPEENLIILGMGKKGKITRIISPLLGGYLTFASTGKCKTAGGQIKLSKLKEIYRARK